MNRFDGFLRWAWSILVVSTLAFALGGCDGDDGAAGATGPMGATGADGSDGSDGSDGPPGPGASITPLESCGVCHDDGSFASAPAHHALDPIELVSNVTFAVNRPGSRRSAGPRLRRDAARLSDRRDDADQHLCQLDADRQRWRKLHHHCRRRRGRGGERQSLPVPGCGWR